MLEALQTELSDLVAKRAELDERIAHLTETVKGLSYLMGHDGSTGVLGLGLTDAIRKALGASGGPMTPVEIRAALMQAGFDIYKYTDIIPSIHAILKRLFEADEVVIVKAAEVRQGGKTLYGKKFYLWNEPENIDRIVDELAMGSGGIIYYFGEIPRHTVRRRKTGQEAGGTIRFTRLYPNTAKRGIKKK